MSATAAPPMYCLDANVFIQAYQKYYSFDLCPNYWDLLNDMGTLGEIMIPREIADEMTAKDDQLTKWIAGCRIEVRETNAAVIQCWKDMIAAHPMHKFLADNKKDRSLGDPWLIAHAMACGGVVVSKEQRTSRPLVKSIRIPDVCDNMGIRCISDFEFLQEIGVRFRASHTRK